MRFLPEDCLEISNILSSSATFTSPFLGFYSVWWYFRHKFIGADLKTYNGKTKIKLIK